MRMVRFGLPSTAVYIITLELAQVLRNKGHHLRDTYRHRSLSCTPTKNTDPIAFINLTACFHSPSGMVGENPCFALGIGLESNLSIFTTGMKFFCFASEVKALLATGLIQAEANTDALREYIVFQALVSEENDVQRYLPTPARTLHAY